MPQLLIPGIEEREFDWFAYLNRVRDGRRIDYSQTRDGGAFAELQTGLTERGLRYGRLVPNGPPTREVYRENERRIKAALQSPSGRRIEDLAEYSEIAERFLERIPLVTIITRLPLDDRLYGDKRASSPGYTSLEQKIFRLCRPLFPLDARSRLRIARELAEQLPAEYANRADITFRQNTSAATYKELRVHPNAKATELSASESRSALYLVHLEGVESLRGAGLLLCFGMSGWFTMGFAHRLRYDLSWLLDGPAFAMLEVQLRDVSVTGRDEHFSDRWEINVLLETKELPAIPDARA